MSLPRTVALAVALAGVACASTRRIDSDVATNRPSVELRESRKLPRPQPAPHELLIRYLRSGGLYFEWQGQALLTAPFATNYPLTDLNPPVYRFGPKDGPRFLPLQRIAYDHAALAWVLDGLPLGRVGAILVGHSHYDHLGDLPPVARRMPGARVYVNDSGQKLLAGEAALRGRVRSVEHERAFLPACSGERCLIRFAAIPSEHAPNVEVLGLDLAWQPGEVRDASTRPLAGQRLTKLKAGKTLAFLVDFLDPADPSRVAFRVHYQDAASRPEHGYPSAAQLAERPVDLEVVTMPGRETLPEGPDAYPVGVLRRGGARHALVIHYEDFFRPVLRTDGTSNGVRLIPTLAGAPAEDFLRAVDSAIERPDPRYCALPTDLEGLCSDAFTLPLPGEWLLVDTRSEAASPRVAK
jgi:hypothetical protein